MNSLQVFDPPMCCSTGVCGPQVDPALVAFAAFLQQAAQRGCKVERFNLGQQPLAFLENSTVKGLLDRGGVEALPVLLVDGQVALQGRYPDATEQAAWLNAPTNRAAEGRG